jgi:GH18 family chitinase
MTYGFHGTWDVGNKWTGPWLNAHTNLTEIKESMDLLWRNGIDPEKVVLGMAFYGRTFTLTVPSCNKPGCAYASGGEKLRCSGDVGVALNSEIQQLVAKSASKPEFYRDAAVKVLQYNDDQWVSYDDADTIQLRADFARSQCLGGVMVWAVSQDDMHGNYSRAVKKAANRQSALVYVEDELMYTLPPQKARECTWTNCLEGMFRIFQVSSVLVCRGD